MLFKKYLLKYQFCGIIFRKEVILIKEEKVTKRKMRILSGALVMCAFGMTGANAVPSVRMLGNNSARIGTNATAVKSENTTSTQRLGTIRSKTVSTGTPVTVNKVITSSNAANSGDEARLSLGKYIHSTGVSSGTIKPVTTTPGVSSSDITSLADRVSDLEKSKQDKLTVDTGLVLENNVISLDDSVFGLQEQIDDLQDQLDAKLSADDLDETVYDVVEEQIGEDLDTVYDAATGERKYVAIVDEFTDKDFELIQKQGEN